MPTYESTLRFVNEYERLDDGKQGEFLARLQEFIAALHAWEDSGMPGHPSFPMHLGVKRMAGRQGIWEFAWSGDGRCTWNYSKSLRQGKCHVVWRRIGTHAIYDDP